MAFKRIAVSEGHGLHLAFSIMLVAAAMGTAGIERPVSHREPNGPTLEIPDSLRGLSGRIRLRMIHSGATPGVNDSLFVRVFGSGALARHRLLAARDSGSTEAFLFAPLVPFSDRRKDGRVGLYRVGRWPYERRAPRSEAYRVPEGFISVDSAQQDFAVSTHFRLGDFITSDQRAVWPKVLVLDLRLIDKLELIVTELQLAGKEIPGLTVLSGFRTPQVNARGARSSLTADSRHQYGDAADFIVDADGDRMLDDLNGDKRRDFADALYLAAIVSRVEERYPSLVGGVGVYRAAPGRSSFIHVDARGERFRWGFP